MRFTLKQAQDLVAVFGDDEETEITAAEVGSDDPNHSGPGLYAYFSEYPDEGTTLLG